MGHQENERGGEETGGQEERAVSKERHDLPKIYQSSLPSAAGPGGRGARRESGTGRRVKLRPMASRKSTRVWIALLAVGTAMVIAGTRVKGDSPLMTGYTFTDARVLDNPTDRTLEGHRVEKIPQSIALPTSISYSPYKVGAEVFPELPGSLFTGNNFPDCKIGFTAEEIGAQTGENN